MNKIVGMLCAAGMAFAFASPATLQIGDSAPLADVKMDAIDGKQWSVADAKKANGVLVMFSCNTCPYVLAWEYRYNEIAKTCKDNNIGLLVLNSNEQNRTTADSKEAMVEHAQNKGYTFPYLIDRNHRLADAYGAMRTPDLFLFDKNLKLVYKGAIDNTGGRADFDKKQQQDYIFDAIRNMLKGKPATPAVTKSIGCSIKRVS